jgi:hypothetical protein
LYALSSQGFKKLLWEHTESLMGAYGEFMGGFGAICHKALSRAGQRIEGDFSRNIVYDKLEIMTSSRG